MALRQVTLGLIKLASFFITLSPSRPLYVQALRVVNARVHVVLNDSLRPQLNEPGPILRLGFEPRTLACKANVLTTTLPCLSMSRYVCKQYVFDIFVNPCRLHVLSCLLFCIWNAFKCK